MEWPDTLAARGGYGSSEEEREDEGDLDMDEDFYGDTTKNVTSSNGHASSRAGGNGVKTGVPEPNGRSAEHYVKMQDTIRDTASIKKEPSEKVAPTASMANVAEQKADNERRAQILRAKLIAQRQNTPTGMASRVETPARMDSAVLQPPSTHILKKEEHDVKGADQSHGVFGLDSLLAEGRAAAEAKTKHQQEQTQREQTQREQIQRKQTGREQTQHATRRLPQTNSAPFSNGNTPLSNSKATHPLGNLPLKTVAASEESAEQSNASMLGIKLTDPYYADLQLWLEVTGYHDVAYRNSKLHSFKERKELEEQAARIAERLDDLRRAEQVTIEDLRTSPAHPTAAPRVEPIRSQSYTVSAQGPERLTPPTGYGAKRPHSPDPIQQERESRRRGANGAPETRVKARSRPLTPVTALVKRRTFPSDTRRRSLDELNRENGRDHSRDSSMERRQANYWRDSETVAPRDRADRRAPHSPRLAPPSNHDSRPKTGYSSVNQGVRGGLPTNGENRVHQQPQYKGGRSLDLRKGGVRYFMIKSWNHANVEIAMRDALWTTQMKNEQILADAYSTARHVILFFSVNKSMAFQGYAVMSSPPDANIPKPAFCTKLNWGTSQAFTLRWLAMTSVHFRHVGHLKNHLNVDDRGQPMAVLVGKDGQEISAEAGMGLCEIMDEASEGEWQAGGY